HQAGVSLPEARAGLEKQAAVESLACLVQPGPLAGAGALRWWREDQRLLHELQDRIAFAQVREEQLRRTAGLTRIWLAWAGDADRDANRRSRVQGLKLLQYRREAGKEIQHFDINAGPGMAPLLGAGLAFGSLFLGLLAVAFWVAAWVFWAFVFRGGLTLPLLGISLLRRNG